MSVDAPARLRMLGVAAAALLLLAGCATSAHGGDGSTGADSTATAQDAPLITGQDYVDVPTCEQLFFGGDDDPAGTFRSLLRDDVSAELADQYLDETSNLCGDEIRIGQSVLFTMMSVGVTMNQFNVRFETLSGDVTVEGVRFPGEIDGWRLVHAEELVDFQQMFEHASSGESIACPSFSTNIDAVTTDGRVHGVYVPFPEAIANHGCPMGTISIAREPTAELPGMLTGEAVIDVDGASCIEVVGVACGVTDGTTAWAGYAESPDAVQTLAGIVGAVADAN